MKKLTSITLAVLLALSLIVFTGCSSETVKVTIADGSLVMTVEEVKLKDMDGDGALTINDALIAAHDKKYPGGSEAGYASATGEYGLYITKLWGDESGAYSYYQNGISAMSLADPVTDGSRINAFIYQDQTGWSDTYCEFSNFAMTVEAGANITVCLEGYGFDENFESVKFPVAGAEITIDGAPTGVLTGEDGCAEISAGEKGDYIISAISADSIIVPPVLELTVGK